MSTNSNSNPNSNFRVRNNQQNQQNQNQAQNQSQPQNRESEQLNKVVINPYLSDVVRYCSEARKAQLTDLSQEMAVKIVLTADRLGVDRLAALDEWQVCENKVVIQARFLLDLFSRQNLLKQNFINNNSTGLALMGELRKAFPDTLIGVICPEEIPPSVFFSLSKNLLKLVTVNYVILFVITASILTVLALFFGLSRPITNLMLMALGVTLFGVQGIKERLNRYSLKSVIKIFRKLDLFIGSLIENTNIPENTNNSNFTNVPKTTKLSQPQEEEMYLDLASLEVVKPRASYKTNPLNHPNQTTTFDDSNQTSFLN